MQIQLTKAKRELQVLRAQLQDQLQQNQELTQKLVHVQAQRDLLYEECQIARKAFQNIQNTTKQKIHQAREQEAVKFKAESLRIQKLHTQNQNLLQAQSNLMRSHRQLETKLQQTKKALRQVLVKHKEPIDVYRHLDAISFQDQIENITNLTQKYASLEAQTQKLVAQNKVLRKLAGVPDNYGFDLNAIIIAQKNQVQDYRKQLRMRQLQIQDLEAQRAQLRFRLRELARSNTKVFFQDLTQDQQNQVNLFILGLKQGKKPIRETRQAELDQLRQKISMMDIKRPRAQNNQIKQLLKQNQQLKQMIQNLLEPRPVRNKSQATRRHRLDNQSQDDRSIQISRVDRLEESRKMVTQQSKHNQYLRVIDPAKLLNMDKHNIEGFSNNHNCKINIDLDEHVQPQRFAAACMLYTVQLQAEVRAKDEVLLKLQDQLAGLKFKLKKAVESKDRAVIQVRAQLDQLVQQRNQLSVLLKKAKIESDSLQGKVQTLESKYSKGDVILKMASLQEKVIRLSRTSSSYQQDYISLRNLYEIEKNQNKKQRVADKEKIAKLKQSSVRSQEQLIAVFKQLQNSVSRQDYQKILHSQTIYKQKLARSIVHQGQLVQKLDILSNAKNQANRKRKQILQLEDTVSLLLVQNQMISARLSQYDKPFRQSKEILKQLVAHCNMNNVSMEQELIKNDSDFSGTIQFKEFVNLLCNIKSTLTQAQAKLLFDFMDLAQSGTIQTKELTLKLRREGATFRSNNDLIVQKVGQAIQKADVTLEQAFKIIDVSGNGLIQKEEMQKAFLSMNLPLTAADLKAFWDMLDPQGKNKIGFRQFSHIFRRSSAQSDYMRKLKSSSLDWKYKLMSQIRSKASQKGIRLIDLFNEIDTSKSGTIQKDELYRLLSSVDVRVNFKQCQQIFNLIDKDKSGRITYQQFSIFLRECQCQTQRFQKLKIVEQRQQLLNSQSRPAIQQQSSSNSIQIKMNSLRLKNESLQKKVSQLTALQVAKQQQNIDLGRKVGQLQDQIFRISQTLILQKQKVLEAKLSLNQSHLLKQNQEYANKIKLMQLQLTAAQAGNHTFQTLYQNLANQLQGFKIDKEILKSQIQASYQLMKEYQAGSDQRLRVGKLTSDYYISKRAQRQAQQKVSYLQQQASALKRQALISQQNADKLTKQINSFNSVLKLKTEAYENQLTDLRGKTFDSVSLQRLQQQQLVLREFLLQKSDLQNQNAGLQAEMAELQNQLTYHRLNKQKVQNLQRTLKTKNPDQLSTQLFQTSQRLVQYKTNELKLKRQTMQAKEKEQYFHRLYLSLQENSKSLQKQLSDWQSKFNKRQQFWRTKLAQQSKKVELIVQERLQQQSQVLQASKIFQKKKQIDRKQKMQKSMKSNQAGMLESIRLLEDQNRMLRSKPVRAMVQSQILQDEWGEESVSRPVNIQNVNADNRFIATLKNRISELEKESQGLRQAAQQSMSTLQSLIDSKNQQIRGKVSMIEQLNKQLKKRSGQHQIQLQQLSRKLLIAQQSKFQKSFGEQDDPKKTFSKQAVLRQSSKSIHDNKRTLKENQSFRKRIIDLEKQNDQLKIRTSSKFKAAPVAVSVPDKQTETLRKLLAAKELQLRRMQKSLVEVKQGIIKEAQEDDHRKVQQLKRQLDHSLAQLIRLRQQNLQLKRRLAN